MKERKTFWDKNAGRYDRFMRKDRAAYDEMYKLIRPVVKAKTVLELATGKSVYSKDLLMADEKLVLHLESLETIPKNGISFKDDAGRERRFAILQSGKDGSIYLQEIE